MRYCLMRQRVEEEREGDKEQVSFKKGKKKEPVEKCGGGDLSRLFLVACKERT